MIPRPSWVPEPRASLGVLPVPTDLYCTLEVDSFGYFVNKAKTRVFRDTTEPKWDEVSGPRRDPGLIPHHAHPAPSALVLLSGDGQAC